VKAGQWLVNLSGAQDDSWDWLVKAKGLNDCIKRTLPKVYSLGKVANLRFDHLKFLDSFSLS